MRPAIAIVAGVLGLAFGAARAGTVIETETTDSRTGKAIERTVVSAEGENLRLERQSAFDPTDRALAIYAGGRLYVVDERTKAYRVMDRTAIESIEAARAADAAQMGADDPAAARGRTGAKRAEARPEPKLVDTGRSEKAGQWSCRVWNATVRGRVVAQHCVVPVAKLGGAADLTGALRSFSRFWREVAADYPGLQDTGGRLAQSFERTKGLPVRTKIFHGGKPREVVAVRSVRQQALGAQAFQVPAGYERQNMVREARAPAP